MPIGKLSRLLSEWPDAATWVTIDVAIEMLRAELDAPDIDIVTKIANRLLYPEAKVEWVERCQGWVNDNPERAQEWLTKSTRWADPLTLQIVQDAVEATSDRGGTVDTQR